MTTPQIVVLSTICAIELVVFYMLTCYMLSIQNTNKRGFTLIVIIFHMLSVIFLGGTVAIYSHTVGKVKDVPEKIERYEQVFDTLYKKVTTNVLYNSGKSIQRVPLQHSHRAFEEVQP